MMLRLNVDELTKEIENFDVFRTVGSLSSARGILTARLPAAVGELCHILGTDGRRILAEVVGFDGRNARIMPFRPAEGLEPDTPVVGLGRRLRVPVGDQLLGRVVNALGAPIDGRGRIYPRRWSAAREEAPAPMDRTVISKPFVTGQRVIDGLLTIGEGQRVGLFAGSGVGKSTLLGDIARYATSDLNVIALIGERGREVRPFLESCLGEDGLRRSVVVVSSADQPPIMRVRAAQTAISIASDFRRRGGSVLLLLDSVTRLAMAQREIGLLLGEPPSARGYTPSVFELLTTTLERLGPAERGTITAILTVLVDGDDLDEPVSDTVRAIVDGHVVLSRALAERNHFPAVDVAASVSRVFRDVTHPAHQSAAAKLRSILATHAEVADLIRINAYSKGASPQVDRAIELLPAVETFLRQSVGQACPYDQTLQALLEIGRAWPFD